MQAKRSLGAAGGPSSASVIIATYNRGEILPRTLDTVLNQTCQGFRVIVVDQSPVTAPELASYLEAHGDRVEYYRLTRPNLPAARNFGIRKAAGEIIIFVDDDVEVPPDYVANHLMSYEDERVAGVTGLTFSSPEQTLDYVVAGSWRGYGIRGPVSDSPVPVTWLDGCNMSYRREALVEAGLFDERFTGSAWAEDRDMAVRVRRLGHRLVLNPKVRLLHLALPSGGCSARDPELKERVHRERARLWTLYCVKNWDMVGFRDVVTALFRGYRALALNRPLFRAGMRRVLRGHVVYFGVVIDALRSGPPPFRRRGRSAQCGY